MFRKFTDEQVFRLELLPVREGRLIPEILAVE